MSATTKLGAGDLIVEPIAEAVALYDDLLEQLREFMPSECTTTVYEGDVTIGSPKFLSSQWTHLFFGCAPALQQHICMVQLIPEGSIGTRISADPVSQATHKPVPKEFGAVEVATFFIGEDYKDVLQGPEYRPFAKLAKRPGSDSLRVFNHIVLKISQQSIRTCDAMLPHLIYKITNVCEPPLNTPDNSLDATSTVLLEVIGSRLQLGNDLHMTFKRVGRNTIDCLERLKEQNEEWASIWNGGLKQFEPETVKLGLNQIKNAMLNLERMMVGCLRTIHTYQKKKGCMADENYGTLTEWGWVPSEPCYVAALYTTARTPSPKPPMDEFDVENEYDPACRSLREQSQSLKWSFQKQSTEYDMLKYEFRRVSVIYDTYFRSDYNAESTILATEEISEVERDTLQSIQARLYYENLQQKQFFGRYIERAKAIFEQLEVLYEGSDVLLDKLRVLHYPVDEFRHIARRDKLFHAQKSLDFVIKELHEQVFASCLRDWPFAVSCSPTWRPFHTNLCQTLLQARTPMATHPTKRSKRQSHPQWPHLIAMSRPKKNEVTEDLNLNEPLHAGLVIPLVFAVSRFRAIDRRRESASAKLTQLRMHGQLVLLVAELSGESEAAIQATDVRRLSLVQNALAHSDATKKLFDMAMSELKACCDVLDKIEQEVAGSLRSFETISAGFETALTADEINVLHTLRCLPGEARLRRAKILTEVRSYW
ncbi:hypothetical protein KCU79_g2131, partial [Aureobasidium melanogenum]